MKTKTFLKIAGIILFTAFSVAGMILSAANNRQFYFAAELSVLFIFVCCVLVWLFWIERDDD